MYLRHWARDLFTKIIDQEIKGKNTAILMYHSVGNNCHFFTVGPEDFEWQINFLIKRNFKIVTLAYLVERIRDKLNIPKKTIVLTFDDGYADNYFNVFPVLKKHKIPATIFLVTDLIGKEGMVRGVPMEYLNWPQIKEMHQSELIDFEPHSKSHAKLTEKQPEVIKEEIVDSKKIIEKELNKKCPLFAYPFGLRNYEVGKIVEENFRGAVGTNRGFLGEESNIFMLPRQSIDSEVNKERFKLKI